MNAVPSQNTTPVLGPSPYNDEHYREVKRRNIIRLLITYLTPLILLTVYFFVQYDAMVREGRRLHLRAIAENQANTLNLFLSERIVNLSNLFNDPKFPAAPTSADMDGYLIRLQRSSPAFVDIGFFDSSGVQAAYAGPYPSLEMRNYGSEAWYQDLRGRDSNFVITDIYLGFRNQPHFTIAVRKTVGGGFLVLRATLSPDKLYEYITSLEGSSEVNTSIVNTAGYYQVVTPDIGTPLETSSIVPPGTPRLGMEEVDVEGASVTYAYSWLRTADWALTVRWSGGHMESFLSEFGVKLIAIAVGVILLIFVIIINRARKLVDMQKDSDRTRAQLEHASKLASVGELAAGIAHEINNPLAVISEEAGLMKDLMSPEFGGSISREEIAERLDTISQSVFRCRDITRKLLGFVRKTDFDLKPHNVQRLIDSVVDGLLGPEMAVSNIELVRDFKPNVPDIITDGNQFQQVLLNIINNAVDAIRGPGKITITCAFVDGMVQITVSDTGKGIAPDQMDKIFMPFFTTKEVGKGTGLGLSVSYGIIRSFGGTITVDSTIGVGTTFTIRVPLRPGKSTAAEPAGRKSV